MLLNTGVAQHRCCSAYKVIRPTHDVRRQGINWLGLGRVKCQPRYSGPMQTFQVKSATSIQLNTTPLNQPCLSTQPLPAHLPKCLSLPQHPRPSAPNVKVQSRPLIITPDVAHVKGPFTSTAPGSSYAQQKDVQTQLGVSETTY